MTPPPPPPAEPLEFRLQQVVEAPVHETFRACDSAKLQISWVGSLVAVEIDPDVTWGEGATFRQIHEEAGMRQVLEGTLLAYEPDERIRMRLEHGDFTIQSELSFEALGERSRVSQCTFIDLRSMALRLARPIVEGAVGKRISEDMDRLKALLESS